MRTGKLKGKEKKLFCYLGMVMQSMGTRQSNGRAILRFLQWHISRMMSEKIGLCNLAGLSKKKNYVLYVSLLYRGHFSITRWVKFQKIIRLQKDGTRLALAGIVVKMTIL